MYCTLYSTVLLELIPQCQSCVVIGGHCANFTAQTSTNDERDILCEYGEWRIHNPHPLSHGDTMTTENNSLQYSHEVEEANASDPFLPILEASSSEILEKGKEDGRVQARSHHPTIVDEAKITVPEKAIQDNNTTSKISNKYFTWPTSSKACLPSLADGTIKRISQDSSIPFPINEECTSLTIPPSGRHIIAGFTDGTLRLFDTTGRLWSGGRKKDDDDDDDDDSSSSTLSEQQPNKNKNQKRTKIIQAEETLFDCDSSIDSKKLDLSDEGKQNYKLNHMQQQQQKKSKPNPMVLSKTHQTFGAVACQIYARGVITSLLMDVSSSEDGLFAFGGVLRGSTELVAVDLSGIETFHDDWEEQQQHEKLLLDPNNHLYPNLLDLIQVYRYSDAKLKGFGSCTRLKNGRRKIEYRLFTGKGIKVRILGYDICLMYNMDNVIICLKQIP